MSALVDVPVRDAATVMLLRDGDDGLEVFMLRRNLRSDFVGGAYVFPGGGVDDHDRHQELEPVCEGRTDAEASRLVDVDAGGLAFWVAAIRESFEEAGVLLAVDGDERTVRLDDLEVAARFALHRKAVDAGERRLVEVCLEEDLRLDVGRVYYFSRWITPEGAPRRYDTRFFVAEAPEAQAYLHDGREAIGSCWVRPADALARHRAGEFEMVFPTVRSLEALDRFAAADDVLDAAAAMDHVPAVLPRIVEHEDGYRILLPGDPGYDDAVVASLPEGVPMNKLRTTASGAPGAVAQGGAR
jgi:8-oxo-dGTP pyrophosphatase MutT (NUDIX family)